MHFILPILAANVSLGELCYVPAQCDGKPESINCTTENGSSELTCQCKSGFIKNTNVCLQGNSIC